jgi:hypothetical protein
VSRRSLHGQAIDLPAAHGIDGNGSKRSGRVGHRANLVVVRDGKWRLYYDHWCANRLDADLFWGPELAQRFIEQCRDDLGWLDDVWCEGAALLDLDKRVLLFFGGEDIKYDLLPRRALLALMSINWPDWEIRWAHEHIVSLARYLDLDPAPFITDRSCDGDSKFAILQEYPEDNTTLLTLTRAGETIAFRVAGGIEVLAQGAKTLDDLDPACAMSVLRWEGGFPSDGAHLDFDHKSLSFWSSSPIASPASVQTGWPGWTANWLRDDVESHLARAGLDIQLPYRPLAELQGEIIESLRRSHHHEGSNPARKLLKTMGEDAKLNPATDIFRGSAGSGEQKLALLDRLASQLPIGGPTHH